MLSKLIMWIESKLNRVEPTPVNNEDEPSISLENKVETVDPPPVRVSPSLITVSDNCANLVRHFEGFRPDAYQDIVGVWTIGYGFTKGVRKGDKMTRAEADSRLMVELNEHADVMNKAVHVPLHQYEYDALASFIFNVGVGAFGRSTLLRKLNSGNYEGAASELLRWNRAGGNVVNGLTRRRLSEKYLFETGDINYYENGELR